MNESKMSALNVGSLNVRCPGDKNGNSWKRRLPRLLQTMLDAGFDVVGTQETVPEYVKYITADGRYSAAGHGREPDKSGEGAIVFYNPQKLKLLFEETFWLSETPERYSLSFGTTYPRVGTVCIFEEIASGKKFIFGNVHLQHMQMYECQKRQLQVMLNRIFRLNQTGLPVILTGDFNAPPESLAPKYAAEMLHDARQISVTHPAGPLGGTWHNYQNRFIDDRDGERIDYIWVSSGITVHNFETINNFSGENLASSDHFPLKAGIALP